MASAIQGKGVIPTLDALVKQLFKSLDTKYEFARKFGLSEEQFMKAIRDNFRKNAGEVVK